MTSSIEELKRREEKLSFLLKVFVALLILIGVFLVGWMISFMGYSDALPSQANPQAIFSLLTRCGVFPIA
ncbi:MAG: hypothetical protein IH600_05535 [Bacteroidetes bacterium]|nr:hypothetical protein [Bacteroidota bacterium]